MLHRRAVAAISVLMFWAAAGAQIPATTAGAATPPRGAYLLDQYARPVVPSRLANQWLLVYFGYARCADVCPAALTRMTVTLARLGSAPVQPVFVTLDPDHDSPAVLRAFAAHFAPGLIALTGSKENIDAAAHKFSVQWRASTGQIGMEHGALIYLAAPDGRIVHIFYPQEPVAEMVATIEHALRQPPRATTAAAP
jgi:protein SCO1/2